LRQAPRQRAPLASDAISAARQRAKIASPVRLPERNSSGTLS